MGRDLGRRRSASCRNVTPRPDSAEARDALTCSGPVSWIPQKMHYASVRIMFHADLGAAERGSCCRAVAGRGAGRIIG